VSRDAPSTSKEGERQVGRKARIMEGDVRSALQKAEWRYGTGGSSEWEEGQESVRVKGDDRRKTNSKRREKQEESRYRRKKEKERGKKILLGKERR